MSTITLEVKKLNQRGLYIYLPKKYFHLGQKIQFEIDQDLIKGVGEQNKIDVLTLTNEVTKSVINHLTDQGVNIETLKKLCKRVDIEESY